MKLRDKLQTFNSLRKNQSLSEVIDFYWWKHFQKKQTSFNALASEEIRYSQKRLLSVESLLRLDCDLNRLVQSAQRILKGEYCYFGHTWKPLKIEIIESNEAIEVRIDWHYDPFSRRSIQPVKCKTEAISDIPPGYDPRVIWELGRFHHGVDLALAYLHTQNAKYPVVWQKHFDDFVLSNPRPQGLMWANAMEPAIRAINWIFALEIFREAGYSFSQGFCAKLARELYSIGQHVLENLEYEPLGLTNHYFANCVGLIYICRALEPTDETALWMNFAASETYRCFSHIILEDGSCSEDSVHYHRLNSELAALALVILRDIKVNSRALNLPGVLPRTLLQQQEKFIERKEVSLLTEAASKTSSLLDFLQATETPAGHFHEIGDNDGGEVLSSWAWGEHSHREAADALRAVLGYAPLYFKGQLIKSLSDCVPVTTSTTNPESLDGREFCLVNLAEIEKSYAQAGESAKVEYRFPLSEKPKTRLYSFPNFGLHILKSEHLYLGFRCGFLTQPSLGHHAHNDQLSLEIEYMGRRLATDPGSHSYLSDLKQRNFDRSVGAHFCPQVIHKEQASLEDGPFLLKRDFQAKLLWSSKEGFLGMHNAYGFNTYRWIIIENSCIIVRDWFSELRPMKIFKQKIESGLILDLPQPSEGFRAE